MSKLTNREREVLRYPVVLGMKIEYDGRGRATWDGDCLLPFRAHATLEKLVGKKLMELVPGGIYGRQFRATDSARDYRCDAHGCHKGRLMRPTDGAYDEDIGPCGACDGTGLSRFRHVA